MELTLTKILRAFYELIEFKNLYSVEIKFLSTLRMLLERIMDTKFSLDTFQCVSLGLLMKLSKKLVAKCSGAPVEVKNIILDILSIIWDEQTTTQLKSRILNSKDKHLQNLLEHSKTGDEHEHKKHAVRNSDERSFLHILGESISDEINMLSKFPTEVQTMSSKKEGDESNLTLSEIKKYSSIKSHHSEIQSPSKFANSPQNLPQQKTS